MTDAVLVSLITTVPTLVTVVTATIVQLRRQKKETVRQITRDGEQSQHMDDQDARLDQIHKTVNGNTDKLLLANHTQAAAIVRLTEELAAAKRDAA